MALRVAIDTGGTFTDVIAIDDDAGQQFAVKTPSTPNDPSRGLINGIDEVLRVSSRAATDISQVLHGTTTATNAVLEHKFDGLGLIVSEGFRHIIEIARQSVPDGYGNSYFWVKPPRLVPLHLVREVKGRMLHDGSELRALEEESVLQAVQELIDRGVSRIGVCLLHAYANEAHEKRVGDLIAEHHPDVFFSLSSFVLPEYREYERAMTTLIDVMVKPYCRNYLNQAHQTIKKQSGPIPFLIMQSNGGIVTSDAASERPVTMLVSGPAGGVLGAMHMAELAGYEDILTLDVGGTSTDVALIDKLAPQLTSQSMIEHYPVKTPMLDIVTVGTGGGSLAWVDSYGSLKVGPRSAGADPGPICYGNGGVEPTVTDAAVVLGRLPAQFIGGGLVLDVDAARAAYGKLAESLGIPLEEAAAGVLQIAAANQVNGIRQVTVTRGREPGDFAMVSFGGAGGLFSADVADFLDIRTVISPPNPGNLSAFGLHVSDIKRDYVQTLVRAQSVADVKEIDAAWIGLEEKGRRELSEQGVEADQVELQRAADLRYVGEGHEVSVMLPDGLKGTEACEAAWQAFHRVHDQTFGFHYEGQQDVELVNLRVHATGRVNRPDVRPVGTGTATPEPVGKRKVFWRDLGWVECDIYQRESVGTGARISGPGIVEEYGSTTVIPVRWAATMDTYGNLILERTQ